MDTGRRVWGFLLAPWGMMRPAVCEGEAMSLHGVLLKEADGTHARIL
jgi:hypothetical protein